MNYLKIFSLILLSLTTVQSQCSKSSVISRGGPRVTASRERMVKVEWRLETVNNDCQLKSFITVERDGVRKQLCSRAVSSYQSDYSCWLDLSDQINCDRIFVFSLMLFNGYYSEQVSSSSFHLQCNGGITSALSSSRRYCSSSPSWKKQPSFTQSDLYSVRVEWMLSEAFNICVQRFVLQYWRSGSAKKTKIINNRGNQRYFTSLEVEPCTVYNYKINADFYGQFYTTSSSTLPSLTTSGFIRTQCRTQDYDNNAVEMIQPRSSSLELFSVRSGASRHGHILLCVLVLLIIKQFF